MLSFLRAKGHLLRALEIDESIRPANRIRPLLQLLSPDLRSLSLSHQWQAPDWLPLIGESFRALTHLQLVDCRLSDAILPPVLANLTGLETLDLRATITSRLPHLHSPTRPLPLPSIAPRRSYSPLSYDDETEAESRTNQNPIIWSINVMKIPPPSPSTPASAPADAHLLVMPGDGPRAPSRRAGAAACCCDCQESRLWDPDGLLCEAPARAGPLRVINGSANRCRWARTFERLGKRGSKNSRCVQAKGRP